MSRDSIYNFPLADDGIALTNEDATIAKGSAVSLGYYEDPYIKTFLQSLSCNNNQMIVSRRLDPLINRGYYSRVKIIRNLIHHFLKHINGKQIVSFGAGNDTTYFYLKNKHYSIEKYIELDIDHVVSKKISMIMRDQSIIQLLHPFRREGREGGGDGTTSLSNNEYYLYSCDIRDIQLLERTLRDKCQIDYKKPTLFISECVLVYIDVNLTDQILKWIPENFFQSYFVLYEQIRPHDTFGKIMIQNLHHRGCPLLSPYKYPELTDQINRFLNCNWAKADALDMGEIYKLITNDAREMERISKLEIFDEFEEWNLINQHYCVVLATSRMNSDDVDFDFQSLKFCQSL